METKANFVLIGAASVVGVVLIMLFAMWLANSEYRRGFEVYDVVFDDPVRGLAEGGEVRFNGIKVGEVETLRIDPDNTRRVIARIKVSADVPLREDSEARLEPIGLTGVTLIQLSAGSPTAEILRQSGFGPPPRMQGRGSQIDVIVERGEDIVVRAGEAMAAVRDLLTDENIARVSRIIEDMERVVARLADQNSVITRSAVAADDIGAAARSISALAEQTQADLAGLDRMIAELETAGDVASEQTLPEITRAAAELRRAAASISELAGNIDSSPSVLAPRPSRPVVELAP